MAPIPQQLKQARLAAGLSADQLGEAIGTHANNVYGYERGTPPFDGISIKLLKKWAIATKTDIIISKEPD